MTQLSSETQESRKKGYWLSLTTYCKTYCTTLLWSDAVWGHPSRGLKPKWQTCKRGEHVLYLHCLMGPKLVERDKYVIYSVNLHAGSANNVVNIFSLLWLHRFIPISFWIAACELSVLLVMLIVSRPPAECDPFPAGWLWSCLPKEMSLSVPVCVFVCLQCTATMCHKIFNDAAHVCLCVIMCVWVQQPLCASLG